jgi:pSer/pThr/pTyr-binding forkhead associated (FHA) protein
MPKLTLKFGDRDLQECAVGTHPVTIGRLPDNLIVIENPAVSGRHARVYREGSHYVLEDLKSTNGTFVNEKPVARHTLLEGDVVLVGKHELVFTLAGGEQAPVEEPHPFVPEIGGTMMLDTQKQKELLGGVDRGRPSQTHAVVPKTAVPTPPARTGTLRVLSGKTNRSSYTLNALTTMVGKAETSQIRLTGWFKPKVAAAFARKGDGFAVTPMGATVSVNGGRVIGRHDLADGDMIDIAGVSFEFKLT